MDRKFFGWAFLALILSGCGGATLVKKPGESVRLPIFKASMTRSPGEVKYMNEGSRSLKEKRRKSAYAEMSKACGGHFEILEEKSGPGHDQVVQFGQGAIYGNPKYTFIEFQCVEVPKAVK